LERLVRSPLFFPVVIALAIIWRLVLIPNPGFEADVAFWKSWGLAVMDHDIVTGVILTNNNYPTPFSYLLFLMAKVYSVFANPHIFHDYWTNTNVLFLAICKTPAILADFGIAALILWVGRNAKKLGFPEYPGYFWKLLSAIYLLNPVTLIDGALWGQVDSVGVFMFLSALLLALRKKPFLAGFIYMVAMMTKLQNMIYGPVFFLFLWQLYGLNGLLQAVGGALVAFFGLNIEFLRARRMDRVIASLTSNYDYFPWLSLNAYNVWWIASGGVGMRLQDSDKIAFIGMVNAKTVGLFMFTCTYLLAVLFLTIETIRDRFFLGHTRDEKIVGLPVDSIQYKTLLFRFMTALIIAASGFFLFQTESHDRYAFPITVFLFLWFPLYLNIRRPNKRDTIFTAPEVWRFLVGYVLLSLIYFINLHTALIDNYPKNGIGILNQLNTPFFTISVSYLQIAFFFVFLWVVRPFMEKLTVLVPVGLFIFLLVFKNMPLITKKPILITKITPISVVQGYGTRQIDMPVNAGFGFNKWSFLSDQYSFYRHGIGTHAPSREVYDVNKLFKTFRTDYGIDTEAGPQGSVTFVVYGDGRQLFASQIIRRYDLPRHAEVDIRGIKKLELITTDGGDGNFDDHADWLNPMLVP
ncbi:hypothetical protein A2Z00_04130, partial [Candidatus Gottesmanbacteria bacterium RBG_13_45_10]